MATIDVLDAASATQTIAKVTNTGSTTDANSFPVTKSTEDKAATGGVTETAPGTDTASSGLNGRLQRVAQRLTSLIALVPTSLGSSAAAASLATTASTEDVARTGIITETAPATDTASSGLNGRLQRIAQRLTSLIALVPTSLGAKTAANSFAVTTATDDPPLALLGAVTETAPGTDTASSGLNGRLQRIAQRLTSLIALFPTSLGIKTAANSFSIAPASDATFALTSAGYRAQVTVTRPANTTAYTAGDIVGGAITFPNMGPSAGHILITSGDLRIDVSAIPSGMTSFRLYLYNVTPPSALADNAAWDLPSGDRASFIGYIDLGAVADLGSTLFTQVDQINKQCKLGTSETALYGYLVTIGGFTPAANSEVYTPELRAIGV